MKKTIIILVLLSLWRLIILSFSLMSTKILPLQINFLGGGFSNYQENPLFWSNFNFDGDHYLSIARDGYLPLTYFYFPVLPLLTKMAAMVFGNDNVRFLANTGLILTNAFFFAGILGLYKLLSLDFKRTKINWVIILLIIFPTAFYFGAYYTESIFLTLAVWSFYFARKKIWIGAILLAGIASATRLVGISLACGLVAEYLYEEKKLTKIFPIKIKSSKIIKALALGTLSLSGLLGYMYYLYIKTGSAFEFVNNITLFGSQRSSKLVLLPQVFYRYFFKILPNINYDYFPVVFVTYLEVIIGILFLILIIMSLFKHRAGYFVYSLFAYIIPTLSGSLSSLPRYVLVIFPLFIVIAEIVGGLSKRNQLGFITLSTMSFFISALLFFSGHWIS